MLRQVLLLQRDVPKAAKFYQTTLGLRVKVLTDRWAELDAGPTILALKAVDGCGSFQLICSRVVQHATEPECKLLFVCIGRLIAPQATRLFCPSA